MANSWLVPLSSTASLSAVTQDIAPVSAKTVLLSLQNGSFVRDS